MATAPFRFGVVAPIRSDVAGWRDAIRRIADQGYSTVLLPDVPGWQPAPAPALAIAAEIADIRVGTWVSASPLRSPWLVAWEAHSLTQLTGGRFELGLGTGRPGIDQLVRDLGDPPVSPADRLTRIRETVERLRTLDGPDVRTPITMAVHGPRARALAIELADAVTFSATLDDRRADLERMAREIRAARDLPLALHVSVVGDAVAPFMAGPGADPEAFRRADSLSYLPADSAAAVDELHRRREESGFSTVVIGSVSADAFAPVVRELAGT